MTIFNNLVIMENKNMLPVVKINKLLIFLSLTFVLGCSHSKVENLTFNNQPFDLFQYFQGKTKAWGIVVDRFGNFQKSFSVELIGTLEKEKLILNEYFLYDTGESEDRKWIIEKTGPLSYRGVSENIIGFAEGKELENTMNFVYKSNIQIAGRNITVAFDDWFIRPDENTVINRAEITKFGIKLAEVSIFFTK